MSDIDSGDTAWVLASAALVLLMTPALAIFYGGLVGERMIITTMYMSFISLSIITIEWSLITYSLSFAKSANPNVDPFVGSLAFGAFDSADRVRPGTRVPEHAFFIFQLAFAAVTAAVVSGAVVGRVSYAAWCVFIALWHLFVYTPLARWVFYTGGFLSKLGVLDFAGGLVVEMNSGVSAFVLAAWVSWEVARARPRQQFAANGGESFLQDADEEAGDEEFASVPWSGGAFSREDRTPHNVPFVLLGAGLLFFGWLGFNSGSALSSGYLASRAFVNTALAAASGMAGIAVAEAFLKRSGGRWGVPSAVGCATGVVVGLVAITPACGYVSQHASLLIGFFTGVVAWNAEHALRTYVSSVDDTLSVLTGHGLGGALGILATGLAASTNEGSPVNGALFGNVGLLGKQCIGVAVTAVICVLGTSGAWLVARTMCKFAGVDVLVHERAARDIDAAHGEAAYAIKTRERRTLN